MTNECAWIGCSYGNTITRECNWSDELDGTYTNWALKQPDNALGEEFYAAINWDWGEKGTGKWNDFANDPYKNWKFEDNSVKGFICQYLPK